MAEAIRIAGIEFIIMPPWRGGGDISDAFFAWNAGVLCFSRTASIVFASGGDGKREGKE